MTALLFILFGGGALLATGSLICTVRTYAGAALAIGRQLEAGSNPGTAAPGKNASHRRRKSRLGGPAAKRRGAAARGMHRERMISAPHSGLAGKIDRRRQFRPGFARPGTLVFE